MSLLNIIGAQFRTISHRFEQIHPNTHNSAQALIFNALYLHLLQYFIKTQFGKAMDEDFTDFIKESLVAYKQATGLLPDTNSTSRFALAYQIAVLNENIREFLDMENDNNGSRQ